LFAFAVGGDQRSEKEKSEGRWFQSTNAGRDGEIETRLKAMGEGIYRDTTRARQAVIKNKELFEQAQMVLCEYRKSDTSSDEDRHELAVRTQSCRKFVSRFHSRSGKLVAPEAGDVHTER
jgi:hypothetical protein